MAGDFELRELLNAYGEAGGDKRVFENKDIAHVAASGHKILRMRNVEGLEVRAKETFRGINTKVIVKEGVKIKNPVHLCIGVLHKKGTQKIKINVRFERLP